ncbi:protein translocase subunit SecD [Amycolatopsis regifaucium]|uniref:Protein translocase subunit SecD n=1 Tax=Amycolatopsis regifaucium TaxID=546365 RepID=A0A154MPP0_9PSEU|nr:protein translocase subunit SecD [Amycolatopsis regifaucium]KZB86236.1 preprotein translocase subunit SecD [Amycolatopsis regifaucium]OKA05129.1 protein-export membrane protein SecD [Amycolatopsis regifaucium]SFH83034.1 preprotein translocase subunit SecD [Amycolatopsis regifaucium]
MAAPAGHLRPGRYLAFFALILVALYALVFFTGSGKPTPKLGIDLQGGTRVTLTARNPDGGDPPRESLEQARSIIERRVNGIGVSGTEVVLDGSNVVITVPGEQGDQAKALGKTAKLGFRKVVTSQPVTPVAPPSAPPASGAPSSAPPSSGAPAASNAPPSSPANGGGGAAGAPQQQPDENADEKTKREIEEARKLRQNPDLLSTDQAKQSAAAEKAFAALNCDPKVSDPLVGNDLTDKPLVACGDKNTMKYLLEPEFLPGTEISDATSGYDTQNSQWVVNLNFKGEGSRIWGDFTSKNVQKQAAFVLDTQVVSAPTIQSAILGGQTQITGRFSQSEAKDLADVLKYGSLPLSFESSDATTVSATLGLASLQAGLIAGGIGLLAVFIYCMFYYRLLGLLTILSLGLSFAIVYGVLVLLGRWIGYTLDLAGVAGLIIAIGITADSFVIYFERLKDEIREGRTFRSAVPRGWSRAQRTILAADAVSFLAAAVLYLLAVGDVKGFAFTLGMSTVLDLVVVYLVTHPLVAMVSRSKSKFLSNPKNLGLGAVQQLGSDRKAARAVPGRPNAKEA